MSVYDDLLEWSLARPLWQRDALRRIVRSNSLSAADVAAILDMVKAQFGLPSARRVPEPLSDRDIPDRRPEAAPVSLLALRRLTGVNALAPDQELSLAATGITVIYGDNGGGKSGYVRVLRKACWSRDPGPRILGDAYAAGTLPVAEATIAFEVEGETHDFRWTEGSDVPQELARISVFDRDAGVAYVTRENEVAFLPGGLDAPERLAALCDTLRESLRQEDSARGRTAPDPGDVIAEHLRAQGAWPLHPNTDLASVPRESLGADEIDELGTLLAAAAAEDPRSTAAARRRQAGRVNGLRRRLIAASEALNPTSLSTVATAISSVVSTRRAASLAAGEAFRVAPLPGVGGDAWQQFWEAARLYAESDVHPHSAFPESSDLCVLCQQPLASEARARFAAFEQFVRDQTNEARVIAVQNLERLRDHMSALRITDEADGDSLSELRDHAPAVASDVEDLRAQFEARRTQVLETIDLLEAREFAPLPDPPGAQLEGIAAVLINEAEACERAANERDAAVTRITALQARQWVAEHFEELGAYVEWLRVGARYQRATVGTDTTAITRLGSELTDRYATQHLADVFAAELTGLAGVQIKVALRRSAGQRGVAHHRIELDGTHRLGIAVDDVVSEGENRAVALSAFLAEALSGSASAIVADDPTSSLDHRYRRRIARRLVTVAGDRQVIAFTHDIVFLYALQYEAARRGVEIAFRHLVREGDRVGVCLPGLPWHAQRVGDRIGALEDAIAGIRILHGSDLEGYEVEARRAYGQLRETWERAVEEVLLNEAVTRFDPAIQTQRLRRVTDVTDDDFAALDRGMAKCSAWLQGHDQPVAANEPLPDPDELAQDVAELKAWVRSIRHRRGG